LPFENYFSLWHKHLAPGNSSCGKKKGCYSTVFKGIERKLFCLKFNREVGHQSYSKIALRKLKIISVWGINISLQVIAVAEKRRVAFQPFSKELRGNFSA
jgi:hypothetical protein